jgi:uncharacterized protein (TIGR02266 family)
MRELHKRSGRFDLGVTASLKSSEGSCPVLAKNIGVGGVFVATESLRSVGDRLALTFALPGVDKPISIKTEVRWIREKASAGPGDYPPGMGLRFIDLDIRSAVAVRTFLRDMESSVQS